MELIETTRVTEFQSGFKWTQGRDERNIINWNYVIISSRLWILSGHLWGRILGHGHNKGPKMLLLHCGQMMLRDDILLVIDKNDSWCASTHHDHHRHHPLVGLAALELSACHYRPFRRPRLRQRWSSQHNMEQLMGQFRVQYNFCNYGFPSFSTSSAQGTSRSFIIANHTHTRFTHSPRVIEHCSSLSVDVVVTLGALGGLWQKQF